MERKPNELESSRFITKQLLNDQLQERTKELDCLFDVVKILGDPVVTIKSALKQIAEALPQGFFQPDCIQVKISYGELEYIHGPQGNIRNSIASESNVNETTRFSITVNIISIPGSEYQSFLIEELRLIQGISELSVAVIRRIIMDHSIHSTLQTLHDKNVALREVLFNIDREKNRIFTSLWSLLQGNVFPFINKQTGLDPSKIDSFLKNLHSQIEELMSISSTQPAEKLDTLSPREYQICEYIKAGMSTKEISAILNISSQTVEKHRHSIRRKFELTNRDINLYTYLRTKLS